MICSQLFFSKSWFPFALRGFYREEFIVFAVFPTLLPFCIEKFVVWGFKCVHGILTLFKTIFKANLADELVFSFPFISTCWLLQKFYSSITKCLIWNSTFQNKHYSVLSFTFFSITSVSFSFSILLSFYLYFSLFFFLFHWSKRLASDTLVLSFSFVCFFLSFPFFFLSFFLSFLFAFFISLACSMLFFFPFSSHKKMKWSNCKIDRM